MNSFYYQLDPTTEGFTIETQKDCAEKSRMTDVGQVSGSAHEVLTLKAEQIEMRAKLAKLQQGFTYMSYKSIGIGKSYMQLLKQKTQLLQVMQAKAQKHKSKCLTLETELSNLKVDLIDKQSIIYEYKSKEEKWIQRKQKSDRILNKVMQMLKSHPDTKLTEEIKQILTQ